MSDGTTKNKIRSLYRFLREANQLRFRPVRKVEDQIKVIRLSEMPDYPSLQLIRPVSTSIDAPDISEHLLRVKRPKLTTCPKPSALLLEWLLPTWDDPTSSPSVMKSQNAVVIEKFADDPMRITDFALYLEERNAEEGYKGVAADPPQSIAAWLEDGWNDPYGSPRVHESREVTKSVRFDDDRQRVSSYQAWLEQRAAWAEPELAARKAMTFYERMYEFYAALEKDGEDLELLVADGRFQWAASSSIDGEVRIDHPILLKRVELRFEPEVPEFVVGETDREPELYSSLFIDLNDVQPSAIRNRHTELEQAGYHPFGWDDTTAFLKAFIQTVSPIKGEFLDAPPTDGISSVPRLYRDMMLVLRRRSSGIANAVNAIIEDIEQRTVFPPALVQITGTAAAGGEELFGGNGGGNREPNGGTQPGSPRLFTPINDDDILLAKEANEEQLQIIRKLERSGSVIVQGPPGTGKTHTIGNLVGHLLAEGKSVLITAQTAKALRVVRDKVPEMLRPLAVSVLGSDQTARKQLESSISSITERMTSDSAESLLQKAINFKAQRSFLVGEKKVLGEKLRHALENEYREIKVGAATFSPSEAARHVREYRMVHGWIPSPVKRGADLTLTQPEIDRLYSLGALFSIQEEADASKPLPGLSLLPSERHFAVMVSEYNDLVTTDLTKGADRWSRPRCGSSESLGKLASDLATEFSDELRAQAWRPLAIVAGIDGGTGRAVWEKLIELITQAAEAQAQHSLVLHHQPRISQALSLSSQKKIVVDICEYLISGRKLGFVQLMTRSAWRQFIKTCSVSAGEPSQIEHFEALRSLVLLEHAREALQPLWDQLIGTHTQKMFASLGAAPEQACRALIPEIQRCLTWHDTTWKPLGKH